ncbi:hypothetical protein CRI93_14695 [Longimonas halophila]|uniref:NodB homology domain-containing protein n=1 Tax=Longimonas halophila TaxID=1469170 RepID=A0A2H3P3K8_9BACT|nr:polysaccharide deacetylase family protein [Longimonas halophila]PEN04754.1 hypothetical protein CRI93_14695 [Longimonas halophila]
MTYGSLDGTREVVLTFDDGPDASTTPEVIDVLNEHDIEGIFFVVGKRLASSRGQEIIERAYNDGHVIANHTYSHPKLTKLGNQEIKDELRKTQDLIGDFASEPLLFRPPYGATNARVDKLIQEEGYLKVMWNVDTLDWDKRSKAWVQHGMDQISNREDSLVLMHDIHPTTAEHVNELITRIKSLGENVSFVSYA